MIAPPPHPATIHTRLMLLAIDIGNTRLKWAQYQHLQPGAAPVAQGAVFLEQIDSLADAEWAAAATPRAMLGCCVAGDSIRHRTEEQIEQLWDLPSRWVVPAALEAGLANGYEQPTRLGSDRWVAAIGARGHLLARGLGPRPLLVVMAGTAVTVDAVDAEGRFLGGLILPGHGMMLRALEAGTAGLRVPTGEVRDFPTNTSDALTSGGTFAITGAIERMHRHLQQRCGMAPLTLVTGGAGWKVAPALAIEHELVESLIFDGLLEVARARGLAA